MMYLRSQKPLKMYDAREVLEASVMAQRINGEYLKESKTKYHKEGEQPTEWIVTKLANKSIVYAHLLGNCRDEKDAKFVKNLDMTITEDDKQIVNEIHGHYQGKLFSAMGGQLDQYTENIWKVLDKEEVSAQEVGLLVSTPSAYYRDLAKEKLEEVITSQCNDEYVGSVGDKIEGTVKLVNVFYSKNYESYIYTGIYNDKFLVNFWNGNALGEKDNVLNIKGKIKRLGKSKIYQGAWETSLNYVKAVDGGE